MSDKDLLEALTLVLDEPTILEPHYCHLCRGGSIEDAPCPDDPNAAPTLS